MRCGVCVCGRVVVRVVSGEGGCCDVCGGRCGEGAGWVWQQEVVEITGGQGRTEMKVSGRKMNWVGTLSATFSCFRPGWPTYCDPRQALHAIVRRRRMLGFGDGGEVEFLQATILSVHSPTPPRWCKKYRLNQLLRL